MDAFVNTDGIFLEFDLQGRHQWDRDKCRPWPVVGGLAQSEQPRGRPKRGPVRYCRNNFPSGIHRIGIRLRPSRIRGRDNIRPSVQDRSHHKAGNRTRSRSSIRNRQSSCDLAIRDHESPPCPLQFPEPPPVPAAAVPAIGQCRRCRHRKASDDHQVQ